MSTQMAFHSPFVIKCQKGNEKKHEVHLLIIFILSGVLGGILIFIGVGVLTIAYGLIFFGLLFLIEDLLATGGARREEEEARR